RNAKASPAGCTFISKGFDTAASSATSAISEESWCPSGQIGMGNPSCHNFTLTPELAGQADGQRSVCKSVRKQTLDFRQPRKNYLLIPSK
ncbi:hypothetical protein, partial [Salmonella sp. s60732]|uniref:hypothetical protein n=1 Tax=Salmonella sp. s60732 TaxID=3160132 RepID=UPI003754A221